MQSPDPAGSTRNVGIDLARGVAVLLMIQTHALDGWVQPGDKASFAYRLSRQLGSTPTPLFLLLAGVGLALAATAGSPAGPPLGRLRWQLGRRGLALLGYGYLVSLLGCFIEGRLDLPTLLRSDILHCLGLSLLLCAGLLIGRRAGAAWLLTTMALLGGLLLPRLLPPPLTSRLPLLLRAGLGLLIDVAPLSRFPLLPLIGFTALGFAVGQALQQKPPSGRRALVLGLMALLLVPLFQALTTATLTLQGGRLSRAHPAVLWNFADGSCRALAVLLLSLAVAPYLAEDRLWLRVLVRLGRGSLLAYAFHIPLCYGRLAAPLAGRLSLPLASLALCGLCGLTYAVVYARDRLSRPYS